MNSSARWRRIARRRPRTSGSTRRAKRSPMRLRTLARRSGGRSNGGRSTISGRNSSSVLRASSPRPIILSRRSISSRRTSRRTCATGFPTRACCKPARPGRSPFRGLEAFDFEHERIMFGRDRLAVRAVEAVQRDLVNKSAYLLLIGESGAGKSSLARAAVLPRMLRSTGEGVGRSDVWRLARLSVSASESPFALLANALFSAEALPELAQSDYPTPAALASVLQQAGSAAVAPITRALGRVADQFRAREKFDRPAIARLALLVDQLERLFAASAEDQAKFAALIRELVATGLVAVVATLRADRYEACCRVGD